MFEAVALLVISAALDGQTSAPPPLRFEVATVKPTREGGSRGGLDVQRGGVLKMQGVTLKDLIGFAYDIPETRISGGPKWVGADAYDILARPEKPSPEDLPDTTVAPGTTAWDRVRLRLQTLLAERFDLVIKKNSKEVQGYALVQTKEGAKLTPVTEPGIPGTMRGPNGITGRSGTMQMLCGLLSNWLGRPVVDRTGLKDAYNYKIEYTRDPSEPPGPMSGSSAIFSALPEQLGLRLESTKASVDSIVIEKANRPSAN